MMSLSSSSVPLSTLRSWLSSVFSEGQGPPSWEVTPETTALLTELYLANTRAEEDAKVILEAQSIATREYDGEQKRLQGILTSSGAGVEESLKAGPVAAYIDNLAGAASILNIDTVTGAGLEIAVTELLASEADDGTELLKLRNEIDTIKTNLIGLYEKFSKAKEELEKATKTSREQSAEMAHNNKKTEFLSKKCIQYKRDIEKLEITLCKNGGNDSTIEHSELVKLKLKVDQLEEELKPLRRQLDGYQALPPSVDMARIRLAKSELELENLEKQLSGSISEIHL